MCPHHILKPNGAPEFFAHLGEIISEKPEYSEISIKIALENNQNPGGLFGATTKQRHSNLTHLLLLLGKGA